MNVEKIRIIGMVLVTVITLLVPDSLLQSEFPVYRVVLDPGHGGIAMKDRRLHGDRYDKISRTFLQDYREGASYRGLEEHELVYAIAEKTLRLLKMCAPGGDYKTFEKILNKYTNRIPERVYITTVMSREDSRDREKIRKRKDPNAEFRMFDYPDSSGRLQPGRISYINSLKPHIVVSLHITHKDSRYYRGMNPVIAPPYDFMYQGLRYLKGELRNKKFYYSSPYSDWFVESSSRSGFQWFLSDTSLYFTGYPLKKNLSASVQEFKGYRYNMVQWRYSDPRRWQLKAKHHHPGTSYSRDCRDFQPNGAFFDRERSLYERYRREGGEEGYGGDNLYASAEIIRYILLALGRAGLRHPDQKLGPPFISVWHVPLFINAVNAFVELGYLSRSRYRYLLTRKQDEIAEGAAVGIYSLLAGMTPSGKNFRYTPRGKKIDLDKYNITNKKSYFNSVVHD